MPASSSVQYIPQARQHFRMGSPSGLEVSLDAWVVQLRSILAVVRQIKLRTSVSPGQKESVPPGLKSVPPGFHLGPCIRGALVLLHFVPIFPDFLLSRNGSPKLRKDGWTEERMSSIPSGVLALFCRFCTESRSMCFDRATRRTYRARCLVRGGMGGLEEYRVHVTKSL